MPNRFRPLRACLGLLLACAICTSAWSQTGATDSQNRFEQTEPPAGQPTPSEVGTEDSFEETEFYDAEYDYGYPRDEIYDINAYGDAWDDDWHDDYSYVNDWYYTDSWYEDDGVFDDWYYE